MLSCNDNDTLIVSMHFKTSAGASLVCVKTLPFKTSQGWNQYTTKKLLFMFHLFQCFEGRDPLPICLELNVY